MSSEQIIAGATVVNVAVTAVYAFFTWRLWKETRRQAELTKQQAQATAEQARITRLIFEVSHRPVVGLRMQGTSFFEAPDFYGIDVEVKSHGQVPAILTEFRLVVRRDAEVLVDRPVQGRGRCIFPGEDTLLEFHGTKRGGQITTDAAPPVDVELTVSYTGFDDVVRTSRTALVGSYADWTRMLTEIR